MEEIYKSIEHSKVNKRTSTVLRGVVTSNVDPFGANRIKVRIPGLDNIPYNNDRTQLNEIESENELPYVKSLLGPFIHIVPKVDEMVTILIYDLKEPNKRLYVAPITPLAKNIGNEPAINNYSDAGHSTSTVRLERNDADNTLYPNKDEIGIIGWDNTQIRFKQNVELSFSAGLGDKNDKTKLNTINPSIIDIKMTEDTKIGGNIKVIANKILLLSHGSGNTTTSAVINNLQAYEDNNSETEPTVYGDKLVEFLRLIVTYAKEHVHPSSGTPAVASALALANFTISSVLNENVRMNRAT